MVDCLSVIHELLGLIPNTSLTKVIAVYSEQCNQADLSFWGGLGIILPKRKTLWKLFPSQAFHAAKMGAPTTASGMRKGATLNILWLDLRLLAPDIHGEGSPAPITC